MGFFDSFRQFRESCHKGANLHDLLVLTKKKNGDELRITPGVAPQAMIKGSLLPLSEYQLGPGETKDLCYSLFTAAQKAEFEKNKKIEFTFGIKGIGRYKANIVSAEGKVSGIFTTFDPSKQ